MYVYISVPLLSVTRCDKAAKSSKLFRWIEIVNGERSSASKDCFLAISISLLNSFTVPYTALTTGICLPLRMCKGTVTGVWQTSGIPTGHASPWWNGTQGDPNQYLDQPVIKKVMPANWSPCPMPHWQFYCHQAKTVLLAISLRNGLALLRIRTSTGRRRTHFSAALIAPWVE